MAAVVEYLQAQDLGNIGATVAFDVGGDMYLFTQGDDAGTDSQDILGDMFIPHSPRLHDDLSE